MSVPKYVALGDSTYVICWSDSTISWSGGLPDRLHGLLNGRYTNSGQDNSPVSCLSYTSDGSYVSCYKDGGWRSLGVEDDLSERLDDCGVVTCVSLGPQGSYIVLDDLGSCWAGIPARAHELIKTRRVANLKWAALGCDESFFLLFSDGAYYFRNVHPVLSNLLGNIYQDIKRLFLSPDGTSYFVMLQDGTMHWNVNPDFDKDMGVDPLKAPQETQCYSYLRPSQIRFSHDDIGPVFSNKKYSIKDTFLSLHRHELEPGDLPLMSVVEHDGHYVSLNNRRLAVYRLLEMYSKSKLKVTVEIVEQTGDFSSRYSTQCHGEYAYLRHTPYWIGRTKEETNFDPFNHKLTKTPVAYSSDSEDSYSSDSEDFCSSDSEDF